MNRFKTKVCLGIIVDEHEIIRLAAVNSNELQAPWPLELRKFPDLESLEGYWLDWLDLEYSVDRVSVIAYGERGLDVLDWLAERHSAAMEEFALPTYLFHSQVHQFKVPDTFTAAYSQAMGCLFRERAVEFTDLIIEEADKLQTTLRTLAEQLECLRATLPRHQECPF